MTRADGIHDAVDEAEYLADKGSLSSTGARKLVPPSTPAHFKYWLDHPPPTSDAFDLGHVVHKLVLGAGADYFPLDPAVHGLKKDGTVADSPRATSTWKAADAEARANGLAPIHVDDLTAAQAMADKVLTHPDAGPLFTGEGRSEVSVYATDPTTGVKLRARFDRLNPGEIVDLKTSVTAEPDQFGRAAAKYSYHFQAAFYLYVAELAGITVDRFRFAVVEKQPPHLVSVVEYDSLSLIEGGRQVCDAIYLFAHCRETDAWPGYPDGVQLISLPDWAFDDDLELRL